MNPLLKEEMSSFSWLEACSLLKDMGQEPNEKGATWLRNRMYLTGSKFHLTEVPNQIISGKYVNLWRNHSTYKGSIMIPSRLSLLRQLYLPTLALIDHHQ